MTSEQQNSINIYQGAEKAVAVRLILFALLSIIAINISGCATTELWKKERTVVTKTLHSRNAGLKSILTLGDKDSPEQTGIFLLYQNRFSFGATDIFPPFTEGYLILMPGWGTTRLVRRINDIESALKENESLYIPKVKVYKITNQEEEVFYELDMEVGRKLSSGGIWVYQLGTWNPAGPARFRIKFENTLEDDDDKPTPININASNAEMSFLECSRFISEYKHPSKIARAVGTPFAFAFDVVTSPFQLIAVLTAPLWMPNF